MSKIGHRMSSGIVLGIGKNCTIRRAILDKNVRIGDGVVITPDGKPDHMDDDLFCIRDGIVVIQKIQLSLMECISRFCLVRKGACRV